VKDGFRKSRIRLNQKYAYHRTEKRIEQDLTSNHGVHLIDLHSLIQIELGRNMFNIGQIFEFSCHLWTRLVMKIPMFEPHQSSDFGLIDPHTAPIPKVLEKIPDNEQDRRGTK
jgi:hypothetical protein